MAVKERQKTDLGTGSVGKLLFKLSIPAIAAQLINALYNVVDRIYIGQWVGKNAYIALGVAFPVLMLISAFAALVGMGGAPLASIKMGEKNHPYAEKIMGNCFSMLLIISVILTVVIYLFRRPMLLLFGGTADTIDYAVDYLSIYLIGTVFVQLALGLNSFITAQGFSGMGMLTVAIGAVINIVLDPLFIFVFGMGVKGAALATIISQAVSAVWVLCFLLGKKTILKLRRSNLRLSKTILLPVLALGMSPFIMQSTESILSITFNASLKYYGGVMAVGAITTCTTIMQMLNMPFLGMTQGASPIISYNYGARKIDRVKKTFKMLFFSCLMISVVFWAVLMLFPKWVAMLFNGDPELLEITAWAIRIYAGAMFIMGVQISCQQTFVALGQAKISMMLALLRKVILLIPLILILPLILEDQVFAVFLAEPVADTLAALTTGTVFLIQFRKILRRAETELPTGQPVSPEKKEMEESIR